MAFRTEKQECWLGADSRLAQKEVAGQGRPASRRLWRDYTQLFVSHTGDDLTPHAQGTF